jgi:glycosyltransferase involved in cell wall biosynthesis
LVYDFALNKKKPLFVACGEGDNALENMVAEIPKKKLDRLVKAVTGMISVSSENKRKCLDYGLITEDKVDVFPNCVNTEIFHQMDVAAFKQKLEIKEKDFVIVSVGVFTHRKGLDRVAKAITKLNDPNIKVIFVGKAFPGYPYDFDCPGILHKGPLNHDELPKYMNCADVFVLPTQKEGCCNAIVEALAMGLPVISSDGPFNDDILDVKNSIRIDSNDIDAIAAAIKKLKDDKVLRQDMSEYSLSRHEEYSIKGRAKKILEFIERLTNN